MNASELRNALMELGLGQAQFARLVEVTPRAVSLWLAGEREIPGPVEAYLNLLSSLPKALFVKELARLKQEVSDMYEGMYLFSYHGQKGGGHGLLVLMNGAVFGYDGGVHYDGSYQPSASTPGNVDVNLHMTIPPGVALVQGVPPQPMSYGYDLDCSFNPNETTNLMVQTPFGPVQATIRLARKLPN
jgi:transcriptional regulator with XRE-family HTH domain